MFLLLAVLFMLNPMEVRAEEPSKEDIIRDITAIAGYDEESGNRSFRVVEGEFEPDGGKAFFVAAYYGNTDEWSWDKRVDWYGDIWAVKDGVYTKVLKDVILGDSAGGMLRLDMDGRSFAMIDVHQKEENDILDAEFLLYGFENGEPVCFLNRMEDYRFDHEKKILMADFESPLGVYNIYNKKDLNWDGPYRDTAYFFCCEDGEFKELVAEPCTEEEALADGFEWMKYIPDIEIAYEEESCYRIPEIGCYGNAVAWGKSHYADEESGWDGITFNTTFSDYPGARLNPDFPWWIGPYGYRYTSWLNRKEEEKELCAKLKEQTGLDILSALEEAEAKAETASAAQIGRTEYAGVIPVYPGDSLWKIAKRCGGSVTWTQLYEKNRDIIGDNPALIYPGMALRMK